MLKVLISSSKVHTSTGCWQRLLSCVLIVDVLYELLLVSRAEPHSNGVAKHASGHCSTDTSGAIGGGAIDADKAAHSFQEGFIPQDPSPAVLKTEFPPALEHVTEHPPLKTVCTSLSLESFHFACAF